MKLLALDGNSILNRAYYGIRLLSTKDGMFTNGIYGFLTMLKKIYDDVQPDAVAIAFDMRAPTFRHEAYEGYKAQRKGMPDELAVQMPILQELLSSMGFKLLQAEGWEADDILGTLAESCKRENNECIIATGDRDTLQLIGDGVSVRLLATKQGRPEATLYDAQAVFEKYGVTPKQLIDIKAIQGDASDNIPGVKGIGEKGAGELIRKFGGLQYIYDNVDSIDVKDSMRKKLIEGKESAFLSYMLGTVRTDAPVETDIHLFVPKEADGKNASSLMTRLELFSLMEKFGLEKNEQECSNESEKTEPFTVERDFDAFSFLLDLGSGGNAYILCDFSAESLKIHITSDQKIYSVEDIPTIGSVLENEQIAIITHDVKKLYSKAAELGFSVKNVKFDTALAAYLLNPNASDYSIARLCAEYGVPVPETEEGYADSAAFPALAQKLENLIKVNEQTDLLMQIEIPLAEVLSSMERAGVRVDFHGIEVFGKQLEAQIKILEKNICEQAGTAFNINSPKQLGDVLFNKLQLKPFKKTKTGYSTSADVLEALRYDYPIVENVLEYRHLSKLKSTYCDGLLKVIGADGRIHSTFNQMETRTGRISSTEPNLQNIPVRTELGRELRKFFIADEGCSLCDADYSQIELRVLAHISGDTVMKDAFVYGTDIHAITAAQVFHVPVELVTPQMRSSAKAVNFGIVYGIGAFSLGKDIGVSTAEASRYIKAYMDNYSGVRTYMERTVVEARESGYAETIFGRRRPLPEISASNGNVRAFGERVARNMPIQGTAADIIKIAMIRVFNRIREENMKARLILQVHDELIVEAPNEEADKAAALLSEEMQNAVRLVVPLVADVHRGKTWYDAKG